MKIFLLSGKAESGKDSFYFLATKYSEEPISRVAFADEVKNVARIMGWNGEKDENGRSGLIMVGDGARTYFDSDIWIKKAIESLEKLEYIYNTKERDIPPIVCVTDCRYPNEVSKVKEWAEKNGHQAYSIRIERPNHTSKLTEEQRRNPSENALDDYCGWDYIVDNSGSLSYYEDAVFTIMQDVLDD